LLVSFVFAVVGVAGQEAITLEQLKKMKNPKVSQGEQYQPGDSKNPEKENTLILAEGSYSKIDKPFVFVARDPESYGMLPKMIGDFEAVDVDFTKYAVVAAFSGEKETGGYSVSIKMRDGACQIEDVAPAHGAIVTDALTKPFAVVAVPVEEEDGIDLVAGETWKNRMRNYRVSSGSFKFTGGFLGITKNFDVSGSLSTLTHGDFVTIFFDIHGVGQETARKSKEAGSGKTGTAKPVLNRIEGGSLIDRPHPPLQVFMSENDGRLRLEFKPGKRGYVISDGFEGSGTVEAELMSDV